MRRESADAPGRPASWPAWRTARSASFIDSRALAALQAAGLLAMTILVATRYWQDHVWLGFVVLGVGALPWIPELTVTRARRWWFLYVAGIFLYTLLRSFADETAIPVRTNYVIDADSWLFGGTTPVERLQTRFFSRSNVDFLDYLAVAVHWSFFVAPHALAVVLFLWKRELFARYTAVVVGSMYAGLVLFFAIPTAPPWLAGEHGALPGVYRVMDFVGGKVDASTYNEFYRALGEPNSVAAMPSIHMAVTLAMYLVVRPYHRSASVALLVYCLVMGVALVYLGEHYFLDLAVGAAIAVACYALSWPLAPARRARRSVPVSTVPVNDLA